MNDELPIFFVHVAKTGGLSLLSVLRGHFAASETCTHTPSTGLWQGWRLPDMPAYKLYAGHFTYDFFGGHRGTKLIMMREPVARVVSLYDFYRSHRTQYLATVKPPLAGPTIAKAGNLTHFLNSKDPGVIEQSSNLVARQLLGHIYETLMPDEDAVLAQAIRHLKGFSWIGITEIFRPSIELLCRTLSWAVPETIPRENSTYDKTPDNPHVEPVEMTVPNAEEYRRIVERNRVDLALFKDSRALLEKQMGGLNPITSSP